GSFCTSMQWLPQQPSVPPQGFDASQAATQVPPWQTFPAAHSPSPVQPVQLWLASQVPLAQSALDLQPRTQTSPLAQYSPLGQLSPAPGRHATQVWVEPSHRGVAPPQPESSTQATQ